MKTLLAYLIVTCLSLSFYSARSQVPSPSDLEKFALSPKWLGHFFYERHGGGYQSLVVSADYFQSPQGATSPKSELDAAVQALRSVKSESEYCRFVARYEMLLEHFPNLRNENHHCAKFEDWERKLSVDEVRISFATGYIKNPASSFGHLFLKLVSKKKTSELLSYGINFSAQTGTETGALYALKGLFGLYPGGFVFLPYHQLIKDYSDLEGRDIWELNLQFSPIEVRRLLSFIYEFDKNYVDYTFLEYNCAGILERMIFTIKETPGFEVTSRKPWVIPLEAFQNMAQGTRKNKYRFQPSLKTQRKVLEDQLSFSEKEQIKEESKTRNVSNLSAQSLNYLLLGKKLDAVSGDDEYYNELLIARSKINEEASALDAPQIFGHSILLDRPKSSFAKIGTEEREFIFNFALLSDRILYNQGLSEMTIMEIGFRTARQKSLNLSRVEFFSFLAGDAISFLHQPISFGGGLEFKEGAGLLGRINFGYIYRNGQFTYFPQVASSFGKDKSHIFPELDLYYFFEEVHVKAALMPSVSSLECQRVFEKAYSVSIGVKFDNLSNLAEGTASAGIFF